MKADIVNSKVMSVYVLHLPIYYVRTVVILNEKATHA